MMIRRIQAMAVLVAACVHCIAWADLDSPNLVDRIFVNPQTRQATLALDVNYPLEQSVRLLEPKLSFYSYYVKSGALYRQRPEVARTLPVIIAFRFMAEPSLQERDVLESLKPGLAKEGFEMAVNVRKPKPAAPKPE